MKKKLLLVFVLLLNIGFIKAQDRPQLITDRTNGKVTIGFDVFTDIPTGEKYDNFNLRTINQGVDGFLTYNFKIADSKHTFSAGIGFTAHNFYMKKAYVADPYAGVTVFDTVADMQRSKINVFYGDIPLEVNFRIADKFKIGLGFKIGFKLGAKTKFVGTIPGTNDDVRMKFNRINNLESMSYSATLRVAYRWINIYAAYQFSRTFKDGAGPEIKPLSIGIGIRPF